MTIGDIISCCKCGVYLTVNQHRGYYETAEEFIRDDRNHGMFEDVPDNEIKRMIETDTIIDLQFYPDTPVGFYSVVRSTLDGCLKEAEHILLLERGKYD